MTLSIRSRRRPCKIGEEIIRGTRLLGYALRVTKVGENRWEIVISAGAAS